MTKYRVDVSEPAENDLRDIFNYISFQLFAPFSAAKVLDTLEKSFFSLEDMPYIYPPVGDVRLAKLGYRKLIVKNYIVFLS
jgi:plasmid stabilization system protein ParE